MDNSSSQPLVAEDPSAVKGPINLNKNHLLSLGIIIVVLVIITVLVLVKNRKIQLGDYSTGF